MQYDIIIVGSGIAGLYSAYLIKKLAPNVSFVILEKNRKKWIGGRTNNDSFYGTNIVTGAGIARKNKDKLLLRLLDELEIKYSEFKVNPYYSTELNITGINAIMQELKKNNCNAKGTFAQFARNLLSDKKYNDFVISSGYHDYENADVNDVMTLYGMEDNACCWTGIAVNWKQLINALCLFISISNKIKTSQNVVNITKTTQNKFIIETNTGKKYFSNNRIFKNECEITIQY